MSGRLRIPPQDATRAAGRRRAGPNGAVLVVLTALFFPAITSILIQACATVPPTALSCANAAGGYAGVGSTGSDVSSPGPQITQPQRSMPFWLRTP